MAISYKGVGTWAESTSTTLTVTLPTHAAGDMLIVRAIRKPYTTPSGLVCNTSGWAAAGTAYANGSTANGVGVGSMAVCTFYKVATSSSETNPVVTWGATAAPGAAVAVVYQKAANETWVTPSGVGGINSTAATTVNDLLGTHIAVASGDMVDFWMGWADDSGTPSAASISQTGVTYSVTSDIPSAALDTATSNDLAADGGYALATAGPSSAAATITASYGSSEEHVVWMTRLRVTPAIELGVLDAASGLYAPTVTPAPVTVTLGLLESTPALYAPSLTQVTPSQTLTLGLLDAAPALYAPTILPGPVTLTIGLLDASPALYAPTLTPKSTLTLGLLDAAPALYAPTLTPKSTLTLGLLDASPALYSPTVTPKWQLTLGLVDAAPALYAPTLVAGPAQLTLGLLDASPALYAPSILPGPVSIALGLVDAAPSLYAPTVQPDQYLTLGLLDGGPALYAPTVVGMGGVQAIALGLLDSGPALYAPGVLQSQAITLGALDADPELYPPVLTAKSLLSLPLLDAAAALYAPTILQAGGLALSLIDAMPALYAPTLIMRSRATPDAPGLGPTSERWPHAAPSSGAALGELVGAAPGSSSASVAPRATARTDHPGG